MNFNMDLFSNPAAQNRVDGFVWKKYSGTFLTQCCAIKMRSIFSKIHTTEISAHFISLDRTLLIEPDTLYIYDRGLLYPPYPKDRGMLWFYVKAARRPQWC